MKYKFYKMQIEDKPFKKMRYASLGDFFFRRGKMVFQVARMSKVPYMLAVIIHEMVEYCLCVRDGVPEKDITAFDLWHGKEQDTGRISVKQEPGDHIDAPYRIQHMAACSVERAVIAAFDETWSEYEKECFEMFNN